MPFTYSAGLTSWESLPWAINSKLSKTLCDLTVDVIYSQQSRSSTPSTTSPHSPLPAIDFCGPATLSAVTDDVRQAFSTSVQRHRQLPSPGQPPQSSLSMSSLSHLSDVVPVTGIRRPGAAAGLSCTSPPVSRDLLEATDYITDAVTSLVRQLNANDCELVDEFGIKSDFFFEICSKKEEREHDLLDQ